MGTASEAEKVSRVLFGLFDRDRNGVVDFDELASGVTVFCTGTTDEKVRAAFELYDTNRDGYISKDEMVGYLTSLFRIMYELGDHQTDTTRHVSPSELARVT